MTPEETLEEYYKEYKYPFIVLRFLERPYIWLNYGTKEYEDFVQSIGPVTNREVFKDEIVIDIDMDKDVPVPVAVADARRIVFEIKQRIDKYGFKSRGYMSGGTGAHIHLRFKGLDKYVGFDNVLMKKVIISFIAKGFLYKNNSSYGKAQLTTLPTIQLEGAPHRKGGVKTVLWDDGDNYNNMLLIFKELFDEMKENHTQSITRLKKNIGDNKPKVIDYLESQEFANRKDGAKRALFILIAYYKQFYDNEDVLELIKNWNKNVLNNRLNNKQITATIKSTKPGFLVNYINDVMDDIGVNKEGLYN